MANSRFTYRITSIFAWIISIEIIFWLLLGFVFYIFGYFNASGEQIGFKHPNMLWLLFILLPIIGVYLYNLFTTNKMYAQLGEKTRKIMFQPVSSGKSFYRYFLFRSAIVFLILALAQPVFGSKKVAGTVESLELVLCLDISNSMNVKDIDDELSRLAIAKRAIAELVNNLHGEKIGVCVFANNAIVQLPLTLDYHAAKMYVKDIETNMISSQGTNINAAIETAQNMFTEDKKSSKAIILVTDGENHEENPTSVLQELQKSKIQLSVLGLGTKKGGLVPKNPSRPELGYKQTAVGTTVLSKVNPEFIQSIAQKGGGTAMISSSAFPNISNILQKLQRLKRTKVDAMEFDIQENRYQAPLFISILFWMLLLLGDFTKYFKSKQKTARVFGIFFLLLLSNNAIGQEWRDSLDIARAAYKSGEYSKALKYYESAQKNAPEDIDFSDEIGQSAYKAHNYKRAEKVYQQKSNSVSATSKAADYHNLGNAKMKTKDYQGAIEAYKESLRNNPNDEETRYNLSEAVRQLKNQQKKKGKTDNNSSEPNQGKNQNNGEQNQETGEEVDKEAGNETDNHLSQQSNSPKLQNKSVEKKLDELMKQEANTKRKLGGKKNNNAQSKSGKDW